jgi:hypothetical protein
VTVAIEIARSSNGDPMAFDVTLKDFKSESRHIVTLSRADFIRLGGDATSEEVIDAAFRFLLDREPKESILPCFDVSAIARYFPEFETRLSNYL